MGSARDQKYIFEVEKKFLRSDLPEIKPGYVVRVWTKIKDKEKETLTHFEGIVISVRGRGTGKTFTVRNVFEWGRSGKNFLLSFSIYREN